MGYWIIILRELWREGTTTPWPQQVTTITALLSLVISLWNACSQRRLQLERPRLRAIVETADDVGPDKLCVRVVVVNTGPVPFTVNRLGLEEHKKRSLLAPKWQTHNPALPAELKQGAQAAVMYHQDQIDHDPGLGRIRYAVAELASGNRVRAKVKNVTAWNRLSDLWC